MSRTWVVLALVAMGFLGSCDSPTALESKACPQTREFGNFGCARFLAVLQFPPEPWPSRVRYDLRVHSVEQHLGVHWLDPYPTEGANLITVVRRLPPPQGSGDTASVWVRAAIFEDPRPIVTGVPLPVFASDSLLRVARFTPVGSISPIDTLHLTLRRR